MGRSELLAGDSLTTDMSESLQPKAIRLEKGRRLLAIEWGDGHNSEYSWDGLRESCPCAGCRSSQEKARIPSEDLVLRLLPVRSYELDRVEVVGNYALKFVWSDGHSTGIYTWGYLRGMS